MLRRGQELSLGAPALPETYFNAHFRVLRESARGARR